MHQNTQHPSDPTVKVVETSEAPSLSEVLAHDADRPFSVVEVNFRDMSACVVEQSDAPKLTREVLKTLGSPLKTVELVFDKKTWQVSVRDGISLHVEVQYYQKVIDFSKTAQGDTSDVGSLLKVAKHADRDIGNFWVANCIADPQFSYKGHGTGPRIEAHSDILIEALMQAIDVINTPSEDMIYQVHVRRSVPASLYASLDADFLKHSVHTDPKAYIDMTETEVRESTSRYETQRRHILPAMLMDPVLVTTQTLTEESGYPIELLSERYLRTLYQAYRVIHNTH